MPEQRIIIIGASHAGLSCAEKLRHFGYEGSIDVFDALPGLPIQRPPLSKAYLSLVEDEDRFLLRQREWFEQFKVILHAGVSVQEINPEAHQIISADGISHDYDKLVIATGAEPRQLSAEYHQLNGVCVLRHHGDAKALRQHIAAGDVGAAVVIGGGYIGLETAASLSKFGIKTTIIEMADRVLARVASKELSAYCTALHQSHGVEVLTATAVESLSGQNGNLTQVNLADGRMIDAQLALVGIGVLPAHRLAEQAGLMTGNGIHVSAHYVTSQPDIYAIGDVAFAPEHAAIRVESVHHAQFSAMIAASDITKSAPSRSEAWWFWSDQYDVKFQMAGLVPASGENTQTVTRAGRKEASQSVWSFTDNKLVCVEAANDPQAYMVGKTCLEKEIAVSPDWIANPNNELKSLLRG